MSRPSGRGVAAQMERLERRALMAVGGGVGAAAKPEKLAPLEAPVVTEVEAVSATEVRLQWRSAVARRKNAHFVISRSEDGKRWTPVMAVGAGTLSFNDLGVEETESYWYRVRAYRGERRSPFSKRVVVKTPAIPLPPRGPAGIDAFATAGGVISVGWVDRSTDEDGFVVYRSVDGKVFEAAGRVGDDVTKFLDRQRVEAEVLYYRVAAYNEGGESETTRTVKVYPRLPSPPQALVDAAIAEPLVRYSRSIAGGAYTNLPKGGEAPLVLAAAALAGNTSADARLLEQIRYSITGGNEIAANGGYPAQHERHVTAMFALAKLTPRIWGQLSDVEKKKIDLVMKAALVASAFTTSDSNPYLRARTQEYTLDGDSNVGRSWNPNYREGMVGGMLVGMVYFGGPGKAGEVLDSYAHSEFVGELKAHGLANLVQTFEWRRTHPTSGAPTGKMIEAAVRDYRYLGASLSDYMDVYAELATFTFGGVVSPGIHGGKGIKGYGKILSGAEQLPNAGEVGMLLEFDSSDALGPRSSAVYAYDGFRTHLSNHFVLVAGGYWQAEHPAAGEALKRMGIGATDLWYKLDRGYANYQKGAAAGVMRATDAGRGVELVRGMWERVVGVYHGV